MTKTHITIELCKSVSQNTMVDHLGIEFIEVTPNSISAKMPVDKRTLQPLGLLHGGASVALAETLGSIASMLYLDVNRQYPVGVAINASHIKSVADGYVYGTAKPLHIGRKTHVWEIKIVDEDNDMICVSRLTTMIMDKTS